MVMLAISTSASGFLAAQRDEYTKFDQERAKSMLHTIEGDLKKAYYDPKFHGVDLDGRFRLAEQNIATVSSMNKALSEIAAALAELNDSHPFFLPPPRPYKHEYGWRMAAIGESGIFITAVRPDCDAASKGVRPGDRVLLLNGYEPVRQDLWKMNYVYNTLRPQPGLRLRLGSPDGTARQVDAMAKWQPGVQVREVQRDIWGLVREAENEQHLRRSRYHEYGREAIIWHMPDFVFAPDHAYEMLDRIRSHQALVLDLRGNPGGIVETLEKFLGGFFDHDVKIADRVGRKELKPGFAKTRRGETYTGKLVVLVDSQSASAAELFARVVQLEKRGTVLGDRSSGSVMEGRRFGYRIGQDIVVLYGASITEADLIMADGKSLEHAGVIPDERILPTPEDLASGRDPVLARAAQLIGVKLTPEEAGKLFPIEWPKD